MTDTLLVALRDEVAGTLTRHKGGRLEFRYDSGYLEDPSATPLSISMPLLDAAHTDQVINSWLWNLLPDNNAVLDQWSRRFQVSAKSAFSLLSTPVGEDCAGAVRFIHPERAEQALARTGSVTWITEADVEERLRQLRIDNASWLGATYTGQFSLAGAQAKTALFHQDGRWGVPSGSTPTTHILKPAIAGLDDLDLNEHLCLDAARRANLLVARTQVKHFGEESALVIDRYDRLPHGGHVIRVHQEDMCQALGLPPSKKYQNEGGPGVRDIATLLRRVMAPEAADVAIRSFADALIWNWLIGGTDAHAKNYSLLLSRNIVRLAPLYDIASALPYGDHEKKLRLAMKIGKEYQLNPYRIRWPEAAVELGLRADEMISRVVELGSVAPEAFADAAKSADVAALGSELPARLTDLVAERSARCVQRCLAE